MLLDGSSEGLGDSKEIWGADEGRNGSQRDRGLPGSTF